MKVLDAAIIFGNQRSGHEAMALKMVSALGCECPIYSCFKDKRHLPLNFFTVSFLLSLRKRTVLISVGSPYGFILQKLILFSLGVKLIEYTPFPELPEMQDRRHHRFVPLLNRVIIRKRILIETWQVSYSAVRCNFVLHNLL